MFMLLFVLTMNSISTGIEHLGGNNKYLITRCPPLCCKDKRKGEY